jgi:hypothetical protein
MTFKLIIIHTYIHTCIQSLNTGWSAMGRHIFDKQKCFQHSATMFPVVFQTQECKVLQIS